MTEAAQPQPPWFIQHLGAAYEAGELPETKHLGRAFTLFESVVHAQVEFPADTTFANDLSAAVCCERAWRQLIAAQTLVYYGLYGEARNLLRAVYESVGLARVLAKDVRRADKWVRERDWFPDEKVRAWIEQTRGETSPAEPYRLYYKEASKWVHPTAESCMPLVDSTDTGWRLRVSEDFDPEEFRNGLRAVTIAAIFACFAFRNAVANEKLLHPQWRQDLAELAREVLNQPMPHLDRDWAAEQEEYDRMISRLRPADELDDELRTNPGAYENVKRAQEEEPDQP